MAVLPHMTDAALREMREKLLALAAECEKRAFDHVVSAVEVARAKRFIPAYGAVNRYSPPDLATLVDGERIHLNEILSKSALAAWGEAAEHRATIDDIDDELAYRREGGRG